MVRKNPRRRSAAVVLAMSCVLMVIAVVGCEDSDAVSGTDSTGEELWSAWSIAEPWAGEPPPPPTLFPVRQDGKWGYIDRDAQVVVDLQYDDARGFSEGLAAVQVGEEWGYIDESGNMVIAPQFLFAAEFGDGLALVGGSWDRFYIDGTGEIAIPQGLGGSTFSEGLAAFGPGDEEGQWYVDTRGDVVIDLPKATSAYPFSEGLAAVQVSRDGYYGYVDRTGQFAIEPQFLYPTAFSDGLAVVEYDESDYAIIDPAGRVVARMQYRQVLGLHDGLAPALVYEGEWPDGKGSWGYVDETGTLVIPAQFRYADEFSGGLARVRDENGKMAYIDRDGNYVWREE